LHQKISIINNALLLVGAETINSLDDTSREARVASAIYEVEKNTLLASYPWSFSLGQVALTRLVETPLFDYEYAYQLPTDPKRIRVIRKNNPSNDYRIFEDKLYSNDDAVEIIYQFDPGEDNLPDYVVSALQMSLSKLFALAIIQDETMAAGFEVMAEKALRKARNINAQENPTIQIDTREFALTAIR
jgi:hypothetical protein